MAAHKNVRRWALPEATLTLDNTDRALPYDADEVMVTRRYYRSGDSDFYINQQSARLKDIHELFMDTGLGREGYSNVSQGHIDEILALKSTDRREVFEEAAGISKYRHRKEETERRLVSTEENLLRIGDKISELEIQLDPLREQSQRAKKYLALRDELRGVEIAVWLDDLEKLAAAAKKAEEDYTTSSFVLEQEHQTLDGLYRQAEELVQELHRQDGEVETQRASLSALETRARQLEGQIAVCQSEIQNDVQNIARIQQELAQQDDRNSGVNRQISEGRQRIDDIDQELAGQNAALQRLQDQIQRLSASAEGIGKQYLQLRASQANLIAEVAGRKADLTSLTESGKQMQARLQELQEDRDAGAAPPGGIACRAGCLRKSVGGRQGTGASIQK